MKMNQTAITTNEGAGEAFVAEEGLREGDIKDA